MASVTTTAGSKPAAPAKQAAAVEVSVPSRREFLYYIWGASMALLLGEATAGIIWFALPRFKEGTFGGIFSFPPEKVPVKPGGDPIFEPAGRFHVVHSEDDGILVLYGVCTHLGCLPKWQKEGDDGRFRCPCHGSQYTLTGDWIQGPAPRGLDMFPVTITFTDGTQAKSTDLVQPIPLGGHSTTEIVKLEIDTSKRVKRPNHG